MQKVFRFFFEYPSTGMYGAQCEAFSGCVPRIVYSTPMQGNFNDIDRPISSGVGFSALREHFSQNLRSVKGCFKQLALSP